MTDEELYYALKRIEKQAGYKNEVVHLYIRGRERPVIINPSDLLKQINDYETYHKVIEIQAYDDYISLKKCLMYVPVESILYMIIERQDK